MHVLPAAQLVEVATAIFSAAAVPEAEGREVARHLVESNLAGHDSHGVIRVTQYVDTIERGEITPAAQVRVERRSEVSAAVDGGWGFGPVVMARAMDLATEMAARAGIAALTVRHANHVGRLGGYVERLADRGLVALLFVNMHGGGAIVVPWGGSEARLGTNPLAIGLPRPGREPIVLDMTTSVVAEGKVRVRRNRGECLPPGWAVDGHGQPTADPAAFYGPPRGGLLPLGGAFGHKGYGLGLAVELLGGALSGAGCAGSASRNGNGALLLVVRVEHFVPAAEFAAQVGGLVDFVKSAAPAHGYDEVLVPGEVEERARRQRSEQGLYVEESTWEQLIACGRRLGWRDPLG